MTKGALPKYKAMDPKPALDTLKGLLGEIKSGNFRILEFQEQFEVLELPNPGGKPITKSTGKTVKTIKIARVSSDPPIDSIDEDILNKLINEIKSGAFKVVGLKESESNGIEVIVCNRVSE